MLRLICCREVRKRRGWRIHSQSILKLHALLPIWVYSRLSFAETLSRLAGKRPMPGECDAITAGEAVKYADVVESSTPVQ